MGKESDATAGTDRDPVTTLEQALALYMRLRKQLCEDNQAREEQFAEVWCRGHDAVGFKLVPGIFRTEKGTFDEASMVHDFRILAPDNHHDHRTLFDWLCLMQHYDMPTRLLDWTENFLFALYFATSNTNLAGAHQEKSSSEPASASNDLGEVFLLAPRRLNEITTPATEPPGSRPEAGPRSRLYVPDSFHVAIRAALARARNYSGWARELDTLEYFRSSLGAELYDRLRAVKLEDTEILKHLREPVAVRPNRFNRRLQAQAGTFTLHGGKIYGRTERAVPIPHGDALPAPVHLQDLEQKPGARPFLRSFVIAKTRIRKQLAMLGIHRGTLFPELDGQAAFLKARWRHE